MSTNVNSTNTSLQDLNTLFKVTNLAGVTWQLFAHQNYLVTLENDQQFQCTGRKALEIPDLIKSIRRVEGSYSKPNYVVMYLDGSWDLVKDRNEITERYTAFHKVGSQRCRKRISGTLGSGGTFFVFTN